MHQPFVQELIAKREARPARPIGGSCQEWSTDGLTAVWDDWDDSEPFWTLKPVAILNHPSFSSHQLMIELGCIASVIWVVKPNFQPETVVIFVPAYSLHVWCFFEKLQFTLEVCWHPLTSGMFTPKTPAFCCSKGNSAEQSWKDLITT